MMEKLKDVNEIKHRLIDWLKTESAKGFNSPDEVEIMGEVVDMVKDLAEAEEKCMKSAYYENVTEAMEQYEPENGRMGYDRWRYSSGRFAPKGRGTRSGYMPNQTSGNTGGSYGYPEQSTQRNDRAGMTPYYHMQPMGYHGDIVETVKEMWESAPTESREHMKEQLKDFIYRIEQ